MSAVTGRQGRIVGQQRERGGLTRRDAAVRSVLDGEAERFGTGPPATGHELTGVRMVAERDEIPRHSSEKGMIGAEQMDAMTYVTGDGSVALPQLEEGIQAAIADYPLVSVTDQQGYADQIKAPINQLLYIIYALLGLAVVIAVLGIVNTLALSVIERTREIGLLRAVGLSRRQLKRMIRLEAVVIAILGAALGVGLGIVFGVAIQRSLVDQGFEVLEIPTTQLVVFVALAGIVGILAAWWPGRRAAKLNMLQAIAAE